jgi:hypothetical protein
VANLCGAVLQWIKQDKKLLYAENPITSVDISSSTRFASTDLSRSQDQIIMSFMEHSPTTETSFVARCDAKASSITQSHETHSTWKEQSKPPEFETYSYDPLPTQCDAIRLLKLVPSKSADPDVECELITPTKEERETYGYEALSWCWDTEQKTRYLIIRQRGRIYAFYVSPNLHSALRALRHRVDCRYLWIDAICINQEG